MLFKVSIESDPFDPYEIYTRWTSHANRATNATYIINHVGGSTPVTVNQQSNGGAWNLLGSFELDANSSVVLSDDADGYVIADAIQVAPVNAEPNTATWQISSASAGEFNVYARWTAHPNRASNATYTVHHAGGSTPVTVNQQNAGGQWNLLGTFTLDSNSKVTLTDEANGYVIADAVAYAPINAVPNQAAWALNLPGQGQYEVYARWTAHPNRASNATYTVEHVGGQSPVTVNQQTSGGTWNLLGTFTLDSNSRVVLTDQADGYVIADALRVVSTGAVSSSSGLYYIHNDHLGSPRAVTDQSQTTVWRWNSDPFGTTAANDDPDNNGTAFTFNLRFPGQYYDSETGLHYNYFRYYDPGTGRYITSDPIGLQGGLNTYGYVYSMPIKYSDVFGLESAIDWDLNGMPPLYPINTFVIGSTVKISFLGNGVSVHLLKNEQQCGIAFNLAPTPKNGVLYALKKIGFDNADDLSQFGGGVNVLTVTFDIGFYNGGIDKSGGINENMSVGAGFFGVTADYDDACNCINGIQYNFGPQIKASSEVTLGYVLGYDFNSNQIIIFTPSL